MAEPWNWRVKGISVMRRQKPSESSFTTGRWLTASQHFATGTNVKNSAWEEPRVSGSHPVSALIRASLSHACRPDDVTRRRPAAPPCR
jgi:hypothetical protein